MSESSDELKENSNVQSLELEVSGFQLFKFFGAIGMGLGTGVAIGWLGVATLFNQLK